MWPSTCGTTCPGSGATSWTRWVRARPGGAVPQNVRIWVLLLRFLCVFLAFFFFSCRGVHVPVAGVRVLLPREPGRPGAPRLLPLLPHQAEAVGAARPAGPARRQPLPAGLPEPQHHPRDPGELPLPLGVLRGEGPALRSGARGPGKEICASPASWWCLYPCKSACSVLAEASVSISPSSACLFSPSEVVR